MRNYSTYLLLLTCKRRVKVATLEVPQLHLISTYNKGVGDVDLFDLLSASYRPSIRGNKWHLPLFTNVLNVSLVSAWRAHCHVTQHNLSHLEFLHHVTLALLNDELPSSEQLPQGVGYPVNESRFDGMNHI